MNATSPSPDNEGMDGLRNLIADKSENLRQVQKVCKDLQHRHKQRRLRREHHNAGISRTSTGTRVKQGDLVLVKEADSALHNDCAHVKLTHDRWTGPWTVTAVITPGLCYCVTLQGRRERVRRAAAFHIKPYHLRPPPLRHDFGDEYVHFAWGPDLGWWIAARYSFQTDPGSGDTADAISTICSQGLAQEVNDWTASHPCSWTSFTPCGSCINHPATEPNPMQSQQTVNASQLTEHTFCWRYLSRLWFAGTSSTNEEGSNVTGSKSMTKKLHTGGSDTRMETGKS